MTNTIVAKSCFKYYCEKCNYGTSRKSSIDKHYSTAQHKLRTNTNEKLPKTSKVISDNFGWRFKILQSYQTLTSKKSKIV